MNRTPPSPGRQPTLRRKLLLMIGSLLVALLVAELILRVNAPLHSYYAGHDTAPRLREAYYRALFPSSYRGALANMQEFVAGQEDKKRFDPQLGWDLDPAHHRQRAPFVEVARAPRGDSGRRTRILCIGDSFTFGADVEPTASFPAQLGELLGVETVNLGVPGYGIDQAILKERDHAESFEPDLVVLGVYRSDYTRASMGFTAFAKPQVVHDPDRDTFVVLHDHIRSPLEMIDELRAEVFWTPRIVALLRSRLASAVRDEDWDRAYYDRMDRVVRHLLSDLRDRLAVRGTPLLIVQIPSQADFVDATNHAFAMRSPVRAHLLALYDELGLPWVDATERLAREFPLETVHRQLFVQLPSGANAHLSRDGNRVVAGWIGEALRDGVVATDHFPSAPDYEELEARSAPAAADDASRRLIAHWPLTATSDRQDASLGEDVGPHALHARVVGATFTRDEDGNGGGMLLDGVSNELVVPDHRGLDLGDRFEIEATIRCRADGLDGSREIVAKGGSFSLALRDGQPAFYGHGLEPEVWHVAVGTRVVPERSHRIVARLTDGRLSLQLDDAVVLERPVGGAVARSSLPLKIGHGQGWFAGRIDELELRRP